MPKITHVLALALGLAAAGSAWSAPAANSKGFTYDEKVNKEMARKLKIPVYFAVPSSARGAIPAGIKTTDKLIDFRHPDGQSAQGDVGLRLVVARRSGLAQRLGRSGLVQTGDLLLTFRSEWGGAGAYPNVQMGISHTGVAYVKDGVLHNLDNPLDEEYLGPGNRGELTGKHYGTLQYIHIIRPRNLTDAERANILAWATRLNSSAKRVYPKEISFNQDYNAPKYQSGKPYTFVKQLGQIALGQNPAGNISMFCSEFAWSLLALRNCDPAKTGDAFQRSGVPSCIKPIMEPMRATGDYITRRGRASNAGLAEGPLLVIDSMKLAAPERDKLLHAVFVENSSGMAKMSEGHRKVAQDMQPKFEPLEKYYLGVNGKWGPTWEARLISAGFRKGIPQNYSPTSFLINTLLPANNSYRTMDYIATIVIE
ncbi:MAG TPA: hypothetical protein VJ740_03100 [Hyphomicrobiaceae bacterium]|nr:hypothetical protein [Hyphomicrobiaceae bacterium]